MNTSTKIEQLKANFIHNAKSGWREKMWADQIKYKPRFDNDFYLTDTERFLLDLKEKLNIITIPLIYNWTITPSCSIVGTITDHYNTVSFSDKTTITTSSCKFYTEFSKDELYVTTYSGSVYKLGKVKDSSINLALYLDKYPIITRK